MTLSAGANRFFYFAYGSNLLFQRITLSNPSAEFVGIGKLPKHRVVYCRSFEACAWGPHSAIASIEGSVGDSDVYGAVWTLAEADRKSLDTQELVPWLYLPKTVRVYVQDESVECLTYVMLDHTPALPSPFYMDVILRGAVQNGLPRAYVEELRRQRCTEYLGNCVVYEKCLSLLPEEDRDKFEVGILKEHFKKAV